MKNEMIQELARKGRTNRVVTPQLAAEWLKLLPAYQRGPDQNHITALARIISEGSWQPDHPESVIVFAVHPDGSVTLDNGQHTLNAVVRANMPISVDVVTGARPELYKFMGHIKPRRHSDNNKEFENHSENRTFFTAITMARRIRLNTSTKMTPHDLEVWSAAYGPYVKQAMRFRNKARGVGLASVLVACAEYIAISGDEAEKFVASIYKAEGPSQPARVLRDSLLTSGAGGGREITAFQKCISAAVADYQGRILTIIKSTREWPHFMYPALPQPIRDLVESKH